SEWLDDPVRPRRVWRSRHEAMARAARRGGAGRSERERECLSHRSRGRDEGRGGASAEWIQDRADEAHARARAQRSHGRCRMMPPVGTPLDRIDCRKKVTGGAKFAAEHNLENIAYGCLVS